MRRVWKRNVEPALKSEYLYCNKRANKPQLNHLVCEAKCKKYKACREYSEWYFKYHGEEMEELKKKSKIVKHKRGPKKKKRA